MLGIIQYHVGIAYYLSINIVQCICWMFQGFVRYCWYSKGNPVPYGDFLILRSLGIVSSVLGIILDHSRKYV